MQNLPKKVTLASEIIRPFSKNQNRVAAIVFVEKFAGQACDFMPNGDEIRAPVGMKKVDLNDLFVKQGGETSKSTFTKTLRTNFPNLKFSDYSKFAKCDECEDRHQKMSSTKNPLLFHEFKVNFIAHVDFQMLFTLYSDKRSLGLSNRQILPLGNREKKSKV